MTLGFWGRAVIPAITVFALAGCEAPGQYAGSGSPTAAQTANKEPVEKAPPPTIKQVRKAKKKPRPKAPAQTARTGPRPTKLPGKTSGPDSKTLVGKNEAELKNLLGTPSEVRNEPPAMVWSYHGGECSLDVFLYFDVGQKRFRSLAYRFFPETRVTQVERECLAEIRSARRKAKKTK